MKHTRKVPIVVLTAAALSLTACAQSDRDSGNTASSGASGVKDTFTFGAAGAPKLFDPFYATDGETRRVTRQMHSGLLGVKDGTADVEAEVRKHFGPLVFKQTVPRSVRLAEAPSHGLPISRYDATCAGSDAYFDLAKEVVSRD